MRSDNILNSDKNIQNSLITVEDLKNNQPKNSIVLAGNPNVGKSIIFNHLSGIYVDVSNFPGTTVTIFKGNYKKFEIMDTVWP